VAAADRAAVFERTVYSLFAVPRTYHRAIGRDKRAAPVMHGLLS
jgi:hypothetical protein